MFVDAVAALAIALPVAGFAAAARGRPLTRAVMSHFWYFSLIWVLAFPVRALLLHHGLVDRQINFLLPEEHLVAALLLSCLFWVVACFGYLWRGAGRQLEPAPPPGDRARWGLFVLAASLVAAGAFIGATAWAEGGFRQFSGNEQNEARVGAGIYFFIGEFFVLTAVAYVGGILVPRQGGRFYQLEVVVLGAAVALAALVGVVLTTRRAVAYLLFAFAMVYVLRRTVAPVVALASLGLTFLLAPLLQVLRYFNPVRPSIESFASLGDTRFWMTIVSTTFEGVDHVARFLVVGGRGATLGGVDHGLSWAFNALLSVLPRQLWPGKPIFYGSVEQQRYLYPEMFATGEPTTTIPVSFVVDFAFGFGLLPALALCFLAGVLMRALEDAMWDPGAPAAARAIAVYAFLSVFNFVRAGTGILQGLELFGLAVLLVLGPRPLLQGMQDIAGRCRPAGRPPVPKPTRVYFYRHSYLRDRQLDVIHAWPPDRVVNKLDFADRRGSQVGRTRALADRIPTTWKQRWPLVNLKRRPSGLGSDVVVYVWGGVMATGPFIVDLDNPYALTGYNVRALRLYARLLRRLLLSPRCREIRCLSRACHETLRLELGVDVAAKATVNYPPAPPHLPPLPNIRLADHPRFVFVGSQFQIKGGPQLLSAFGRVRQEIPSATLEIVSHLPAEWKEGRPGVTVHPPTFTRAELSERILANADVLVHPSFIESFGMVVWEAIGQGLAVVSTDVYALPELVRHGKNGLTIPAPVSMWDGVRAASAYDDWPNFKEHVRRAETSTFEDALAKAMVAVAKDPELLLAFRKTSRQHFERLVASGGKGAKEDRPLP